VCVCFVYVCGVFLSVCLCVCVRVCMYVTGLCVLDRDPQP